MNKILIGVLSTRRWPWGEMIETSKKTWDSIHVECVETVYYVGEPESELNDRVKGFGIEDILENIMKKNMMFFEWALQKDWDVLCRINASTYVHKKRLLEYCSGISGGDVYGKCVFGQRSRNWLIGGLGIILARDVVEAIVKNRDKTNGDEPEDIALSWLIEDCGFRIDKNQINYSVINKSDNGWLLFNHENSSFPFNDFYVAYSSGSPIYRVNQAIGGRECNRHLDKFCMETLFMCQQNNKK